MTKKPVYLCNNNKLVLKNLIHKLACNDSTIRLKSIRNIKKFLSKLSKDIPELDFLQLWKGLHYALWMTDKPIMQEALADEISNLLFTFKSMQLSLKFFDSFLHLEAHEWLLIDQLRLDKFMMLVRIMFRKLFYYIKNNFWNQKIVRIVNEILYKFLIKSDVPNGLLFHFLSLFLPELMRMQPSEQVLYTFMLMFAKAYKAATNKYLRNEIKKQILMKIVTSNSKQENRKVSVENKCNGNDDHEYGINDEKSDDEQDNNNVNHGDNYDDDYQMDDDNDTYNYDDSMGDDDENDDTDDEEDIETFVDEILPAKQSDLNISSTKKVKFSSKNCSKEFNRKLTPKFDPKLKPFKSSLKLLNKTY